METHTNSQSTGNVGLSLHDRVEREYREMPGLRLTLSQAQRLWAVDRQACRAALDHLVAHGFLRRSRSGMYSRDGAEQSIYPMPARPQPALPERMMLDP